MIQQIVGVFFFVVFRAGRRSTWRPSWPTRGTRYTAAAALRRPRGHRTTSCTTSRATPTTSWSAASSAPVRSGYTRGPTTCSSCRCADSTVRSETSCSPSCPAIVGEQERYRALRRMLGAITMVGMPGVVFLRSACRARSSSSSSGSARVGAAEPSSAGAVAGFLQISAHSAWLFTTSGRSHAVATGPASARRLPSPLSPSVCIRGNHRRSAGLRDRQRSDRARHLVRRTRHAGAHERRGGRRGVRRSSQVWSASRWRSSGWRSPGTRVKLLLVGMATAGCVWAGLVLRWPTLRADLLVKRHL